jgi:4'-phosphopantetheinyl transferase
MKLLAGIPLPPGCPPDVSLWRVDVAFDGYLDDEIFAQLSEDERARAKSFHRTSHALRFATVRAALRELLADRIGVMPEQVTLANGEFGRPMLMQQHSLDFNVSHSGSYGLIVLSSRRRVGVDIEIRATHVDWRAVAELALNPAERARIERLNAAQQLDAFYDVWVMKESIVKAAGIGLTEDLRRLSVLPDGEGLVRGHSRSTENAARFRVATLPGPDGYAACVAWSVRADLNVR